MKVHKIKAKHMKRLMSNIILVLFLVSFSNSVFAQWVQMSSGISTSQWIPCLAVSGNYILAGTDYNGVYRSSNNGTNWIQTSLNSQFINCFAIQGSNIFTGTNNGLYLSSNNGLNWILTSWNSGIVKALAVNGNRIFAGTAFGLFYSTNNGSNWIQTNVNKNIYSIAVYGDTILAGIDNIPYGTGGVYISTNNGLYWYHSGLDNERVHSITSIGNNIFAGVSNYHGVYKSTNCAATWVQTTLNNQIVHSLTTNGNNIIAGTVDSGVYLSNNLGANWLKVNQGFITAPMVEAIAITSSYIFAGTYLESVWRRPLSQLVKVDYSENKIPNSYSLFQNYPNPFNPSTTIRYQIPKGGSVKFKIYDIAGKDLETLVNEKQSPGTYEVNWNASKYSSGVYFYRIEAEKFTDTKRMLLIK